MKKGLLFSTMLLLIAVFLIGNAVADSTKKPVSPSFENSVKSSPASARSLLSAPRGMLGATLNVPGTYSTIELAVAAANPGDQIVVAAGTYPMAAQVFIQDLTITGAGSGLTTITTSFSTGGSGDGRGWFVVQDGYYFNLSGVTLDGAGQLVYQAIRNEGIGGTVHDVVFKNIEYNPSSDYAGTAIAAFGTGPVNVTDCVFSKIGRVGVLYYGSGVNGSSFTGNTYTGKGTGNWLDYGVEAGAGAVITVDNCTISECKGVATVDGSTSAAIIATTLYGPGTGVTITHCDLTGNTGGIGIGYDASDASTVVAHYNAIYGNDYGIDSTNPTVDATNNWWGDASGPAPTGTGNSVSANVTFSPWVTIPNDISVVPVYTLTNCTDKKTVTFHIEQEASIDVRGYEVQFTVNSDYARIADLSDIKEQGFLKSLGTTTFFAMGGGGGGGGVKAYTVSCAILGGIVVGGKGSGDLFTVDLTPVAQGTSSIAITSVKVRDLNNAELPSSAVGGSIRVDCTAPTMEAINEAQNGWYNVAPTFANFGFDDDLNLDLAEYRIDGGSWTTIFSGIDAASWDADGWGLTDDFAGLSQGSHTVYFRVKDDAGNWNAGTISWQFNKDTEVPVPPTSFVALPGNQKVHLTWTNPTGDPTFVGVEIRRVAWGDYPEYGTTIPPGPGAPSYPADHNGGTHVTFVPAPGTAYDDKPLAPRDIYYYAAFSKDLTGNYSALSTTAEDRSTNYWLGDVLPNPGFDGLIDLPDLAAFGQAFGSLEGAARFNKDCDFGPTDDWSRLGIPLPDNKIDFEDLMIFAMNYHVVTAEGLYEYAAAGRAIENLEDLVTFKLVSNEDGSISIVLANEASTLKGIHLVAMVEGGTLERIERGSLFSGASELYYGLVPGAPNTADISAAALGVDVPFVRSGVVARLVVNRTGNSPAVVTIKAVDLRNVDNKRTEIASSEEQETPFVPKATVLMQNFPNPFNPVTTLTFDVAQTGNVTITVYDVSGRLVASLLNARVEVGRHRVEWNGKNANGSLVPSGIYFYRMKTAGYEATKKMILVR